ncbi:DUF4870 domain-containing protein [Parachitinimonas caeni]|uniref:DUF4870 domain-containing protein n=1 Tax=Parachitinimonas caeni TaxID=3031301 RepID=A0ABT7DSV4_9NEIS|nr:DUF4870 domain-containing protein [Parachitinimonas caeni]MDK2123151.1 DUF4870 domain-containing protein [Parachitinimonas caeni]
MESVPTPLNPQERTWGMLAHLSALSGYLVPMGWILGPLIIWLIKKDEMPFVAYHGKEALNFQITLFIAGLICTPLVLILIGIPLLILLVIVGVVFTVIAGIKANEGVAYRYPFALRLIK